MPAYSLVMWINRSQNIPQDSPLSYTRDTLMTSLEQRRVEERKSKPLLSSFQTSTRHFNLHPPPVKLNCPFWTSTYTFLIIGLKPPSNTRTQILRYSFHPEHCTRAIPYRQFIRLRRLRSNDDDFMRRSNEMLTFFSLCCYLQIQYQY